MTGWLVAGGLGGGAYAGMWVWMWLTVPRRAPRASTSVVPWQPVPPYENCENCEPELAAELGRAVVQAVHVYDEMTRP